MSSKEVTRLLYTTEETAAALGIGSTKAKGLIRSGRLRSVKIGRLRRVLVASVNEYVQVLDVEQNGIAE
jgi:excisionase family DNA binding protein